MIGGSNSSNKCVEQGFMDQNKLISLEKLAKLRFGVDFAFELDIRVDLSDFTSFDSMLLRN